MKSTGEVRIACHIPRSLTFGRAILQGVMEWSRTRLNYKVYNYSHFASLAQFKPHGVVALLGSQRALAAAESLRVPVVNVSAGQNHIPFPTVTTDNEAVGRAGARHLLDIGVKHFAFVRGPWTHFSRLREKGFREAIRDERQNDILAYVLPEGEPWETPDGYPYPPGMETWLTGLPRPCGVMVDDEQHGTAVIACANRFQLRIPDDISLIVVEQEASYCELSNPPLTCVPLPGVAVGRKAAEVLEDLLLEKPAPAGPVLLAPGPVIVRQSSDLIHIQDPYLRRALQFIRAHAQQAFSVLDVTAAAGTNRRSLEIRFKTHLNRTILQEIQLAHLKEAQRLLRETTLPVTAVSEQSGFPNQQRMAELFKQHTGVTPLVYRKQTSS